MRTEDRVVKAKRKRGKRRQRITTRHRERWEKIKEGKRGIIGIE